MENDSAQISTPDGIELSLQSIDFFCPICDDSHLFIGDLKGTQVCCCHACQGFLIDSASLGPIISFLRLEYRGPDDRPNMMDPSELNKTIDCPACFERMYTHPYHGPGNVIVNSCSSCQLNWLDSGELASIIRAPGRRGR